MYSAGAARGPGEVHVLTACWSVKGGSGTTVVSTALGLVMARARHDHATLLDLAGEVPAALGIPDPTGPGLTEWQIGRAHV